MEKIIISDISKSFDGKEILKDFSAEIKTGQITALMAPSGSGKTTLLRILTGLEKADSGSITGIKGKKISVVFQEDRLCENLNPVINIRLVNPGNSKEKVIEAMHNIGLYDCEDQKVNELSGGMKRRVALLRALMAEYDILFLDEPFRGLDNETKKIVIKDTLIRTKDKTVFLITHDINELNEMKIENYLTL